MKLQKTFVVVLAMLATMGIASAASVTFDLGAPFPANGQYTVGGVTTTISGYSLQQASPGVINGATTFVSRPVVSYGGNLGVTSPGDTTANNTHAVDNLNGTPGFTDFILFQFDKAVTLSSMSIEQFNTDSDLDYWAGNIAGSLTGVQFGTLGTPTSNNDSRNSNVYSTITLSSGLVTSLLVSADTVGCNDFFKINSLTVNYTTPPPPGVPEPATYATMGTALIGLGLFAARRRNASK